MQAPRFLLIVRERLRPGIENDYDRNELELATACATLGCPHPYLALATLTTPKEVWWLNAFTSEQERDDLDAAYARNERLMAELQRFGRRKDAFRETLVSTQTTYRPDLSDGVVLRLTAARCVVIVESEGSDAPTVSGAVFESAKGERFVLAPVRSRDAAEEIARAAALSMILEVQPRWSFPAEDWVSADPEFWSSNPVARLRC
jgi:hypothetical protein